MKAKKIEKLYLPADQAVCVHANLYFKRADAEKTILLPPLPALPPDLVAGKAIFQKDCASCHKIGKVGAELGWIGRYLGHTFVRRWWTNDCPTRRIL